MVPSDDLFQLINGMTKTEKRYCRLFLNQRIGKDAAASLALFDAIAAQETYDEAGLRAKLSAERSSSHFSMMKKYLYMLLLKGLSAYGSEQSDRQQLRDLLNYAELLAVRGLYGQARKMLRKARKIASQQEFLPEMLIIIDIEYRIGVESSSIAQREALIDKHGVEVKEILGKLENYLTYVDLSSHLVHSIAQSGARATAATREKLDAIIAHPLFRSVEEATTVMSKTYYFASYLTYYAHIGDFERGYHTSRQYQEFMDSQEVRGQYLDRFFLRLHFYRFNFSAIVGKPREAYLAYQSICALVKPSDPLHSRFRKEMAGIGLHMILHDYAKLLELAPGIERFLAEHADEVDPRSRQIFLLSVAVSHLMLERHAAAAEVLHRLINHAEGEIRADTLICGRLLQMIAHYELGNIELLSYLWRSAYYHIRKRDVLFPFEKIMLEFMRELPDVTTEKELIAGFERLREKLIELGNKMPFDLIPWLESKIEQRSLRDIVEERRLARAAEIACE